MLFFYPLLLPLLLLPLEEGLAAPPPLGLGALNPPLGLEGALPPLLALSKFCVCVWPRLRICWSLFRLGTD